MKVYLCCILLLFSMLCSAQTVKVSCTEREEKSDDYNYPIIVKTCFLKNFKFISTVFPDPEGRYFGYEYEVLVRRGTRYINCSNSDVFNNNQDELVEVINKRIQEDFKKFSSDSSSMECLEGVDSIPRYTMNDLDISFQANKISFEVHWGGGGAVCRFVDGTIISFNLNEIKKYLR